MKKRGGEGRGWAQVLGYIVLSMGQRWFYVTRDSLDEDRGEDVQGR
jgi:hypothetical protein